MPDVLYIGPDRVTVGDDFSTDYRFVRRAITSGVSTYFTHGKTLNFVANGGMFACDIGPYSLRSGNSSVTQAPYPTNTVTNVAL